MRSTAMPIFRTFLLLFTVAIIVLEFPGSKDLIESPYSGVHTQNLVVQDIDASGPNQDKDIAYGDEILAINGETVRNMNHYRYLLSRNEDLSPQTYTLLRNGERISAVIEYREMPPLLIHRRFGFLLVAFTFLIVGVFVYVRRSDLLGALFSLNCTIFAFFLTDRPVVPSPLLQLFGELFHDAVILAFPATFLSFFLVFPDRYHPDGISRELRRIFFLCVPPMVIYAADCFLIVKHFFFAPAGQTAVRALLGVSTFYMVLYLVSSLAIFVRNYRASPTPQKMKLRIVIAGTTAGILPFLFTIVLRQISPGSSSTWEPLAAISLAFISISFAYAILKHGAIELNVVVRKSLVYAFLTGAIISVYYTLVNILGSFFTEKFNLSQSMFSILSVVIIAVIFAPARDMVQRFVDRLFYRGEYIYKKEVVEFTRQLTRKLTTSEVLDYFFEKVERLLGSSYIAIYLKSGEGEFVLQKWRGESTPLPRTFPTSSFLARYLARTNKPLMAEYIDRSWERRNLDLPSREFLTGSRAAVCVPVSSQDTLLGILLLGAKRSSLPYKRSDAELLETFTEHLGVVLENAKLHKESLERERLKNEVLLARDIQLRLLPKAPPEHRSFDVMGKMLSSSEVGGDYYDYFHLDGDRIALALGDVSGKGIPAAMLMFSLQAVFKNLALKEKLGPADLNKELNSYLCSSEKPDQFASFFYGILDGKRSIFAFSNAGQNPVLLIKEAYVDRLGQGGMLLGVQARQNYYEGSVKIGPGDMICLYTDGLVEQKNKEGEEFGEGRLIDFLRANKDLPLSQLQERLFAAIVAFGDGRQDDDMSCILVACK